MEQAQNFDGEEFRILFCSQNCFQQSIYHQPKTQVKKPSSQAKQSRQETAQQNQTQEELIYCSGLGCLKEISSGVEYYYHKNRQDGNKFCSEQCFTDYYGEYCYRCMNKFLIEELYTPIEGNSKYLLCLACWEKEIEKADREELEREQNRTEQNRTEQNRRFWANSQSAVNYWIN